MKSATLIIAFVFAALIRLSAKDLTSEDYQILGAVVESDALLSMRGSLYVWHLVEPLSAISPGGIKGALSYFPEARPTAKAWESEPVELDIHKLNFVVGSNLPKFIVRKPQIKLLNEAPALKNPTSIWFMSPAVIPDSGSIVRLSRPVIREDDRVAFVILAHCDRWLGGITNQEVDKDPVSGKWRPGRRSMQRFASWGNTSVFEYQGPESVKSAVDCH